MLVREVPQRNSQATARAPACASGFTPSDLLDETSNTASGGRSGKATPTGGRWAAMYASARQSAASPLDVVGLMPLMRLTGGRPEVAIGLLDGPVAADHTDLVGQRIVHVSRGRPLAGCAEAGSLACRHGTFMAGILSARRGAAAPSICPDCTLLVRPIFTEDRADGAAVPRTTPQDLCAAVVECVEAGARVLNVSASFAQPTPNRAQEIEHAVAYAAQRGVVVVVAAGNQGRIGTSALTRHPWVIPVAACDLTGRPTAETNLGPSISRRGLRAPGSAVTSLDPAGRPVAASGTSIAAALVTGAVALLWSQFPGASAAHVRAAVVHGRGARQTSITPPLLDAWAAYRMLAQAPTA